MAYEWEKSHVAVFNYNYKLDKLDDCNIGTSPKCVSHVSLGDLSCKYNVTDGSVLWVYHNEEGTVEMSKRKRRDNLPVFVMRN